jgi:hypothetical protein
VEPGLKRCIVHYFTHRVRNIDASPQLVKILSKSAYATCFIAQVCIIEPML